jgi:hypothetical protein
LDGEKIIKFDTDVENDYFDRSEEPGDMEIALLDVKTNEQNCGDKPGNEKEIGSLLNITKSSPNQGTIKIAFNPTKEMKVGDEVQLKITLNGAGENFDQMLWVKIKDKDAPKNEIPKEEESFDNIGLPNLKKVKKEDWDSLNIDIGYSNVIYPIAAGDLLETIIINLDSTTFRNYVSKLKSEEQILIAEKRYVASVYFHTLFLYMITKKRNYKLQLTKDGNDEEVTVDEYIRYVFDSYYSDFLLNFGMEQLMSSLE